MGRGFENAPHVQQQVSLAWIKCCDDFLSKAMDDNVVSLTLKEASDIMQSYGISGGDVERSLSFFHEMDILFWVNDDRLRDVVVLDPFEVFVKPIRTIICDTEVHTDEEPHTTCKREWTAEYAWYTKGRLDALNLLPNLLEGWQSTQDVTIELMLKFELMVRLPENIYLIPSLLKEDASFATRRHNLLFFVTKGKLLEEDRGECHAERTVASKLGYIQSGFFHRVLVALINKSFALNVLNSSFYKDAATLSYGNVMYTIRSHKTHISLEVDETKVGSCVELASHVEGVICNVMEEFKMSTFSVYPLLEYDEEKLLSYKNVRVFMDSDEPRQQIQDTYITEEIILDRYAVWFKDINDDIDDDDDDDDDVDENVVDGSFSPGASCKMVIMEYKPLKIGLDSEERNKLIEILQGSENKAFNAAPVVYECLSLDHILRARGDVLHFIGHSTNLLDGTNGVVIRVNSAADEYMKVSDVDLSWYLGRVYSERPIRLIFMSMCDKFPLACMLMSTIRSSGSFYVVCWHGKVPDRLAYAFGVAFYELCARDKLDIPKAFDAASINVLLRCDIEKPTGCFPLLLRQGENEEDPASLLRANWVQRPELIDQSIQEEFRDLSSNENLSHVIGEGEHIELPEGNRNWHDGNQVGDHEKAALSALGFDTKGKFRKWQELWDDVFPKVIEQCMDIKKLKSCGFHLDEVIRLRKVEYNQKKHLNIASLNRSHQYMLSVINTSKEAVNRQISRLSPSKQTQRRRRKAQQQR